MQNKILFIQTGGTIDKDYPRKKAGYAFEFGDEPAVSRILEKLNLNFEYKLLNLFSKDSSDMSTTDRTLIAETIQNTDFKKIIITHGTDTMIETARYLSFIKNKTIVITGSFLPEKFRNSDADFNLGMAVSAVRLLSEGVFIVINGGIFDTDKVKRNSSGIFTSNE